MQRISKRILSWLLTLAVIVSMIPNALAASNNTAERHKVATKLSNQAEAYYTDANSIGNLYKLSGNSSGKSYDSMDSDLYRQLSNLMESTMIKSVTYSSLLDHWKITDTDSRGQICFYGDALESNPNREHTWAKSNGSFHEKGAGADIHHLRPTNNPLNTARGNGVMGNVQGVYSNPKVYTFGGKQVMWTVGNVSGNDEGSRVEVADYVKGDVARIFLYVYVRWEQPNLFETVIKDNLPPFDKDDTKNSGMRAIESLETLLKWCESDPVDEWEMRRNDLTQNIQGNRNVFIDYPELAWKLFNEPVPADMPTPSGGKGDVEPPDPQYEVTVSAETLGTGTVTYASGYITAVPTEGYYTAGATVTPSSAATVTQRGNSFVVSNVTASCAIQIRFAPKQSASIGYAVPEGVTVVGGPTAGIVGQPITLPNVSGTPSDAAEAYTFVGWADEKVDDTTTRPAIYAPGAAYTVKSAATKLYALFTYTTTEVGGGAAGTYSLVTASKDDWTGDYVIASPDTAWIHGIDKVDDISKTTAAVAITSTGITKTGNGLSDVAAKYVISVAKAGSSYSLKLKGISADTYLAYPSIPASDTTTNKNAITTAAGTDSALAQWALEYKDNAVAITNMGAADTRILMFNPNVRTSGEPVTTPFFRCYGSSTTAGQKVILYAAGSGGTIDVTHYLTLSDGDELPTPIKLSAPVPTPASGSTVESGTKVTFAVFTGAKAVYKGTEAGEFVDVPDGGVIIRGSSGDTIKLWVKATKADMEDSDLSELKYTIKKADTSTPGTGGTVTPANPAVKAADVKVNDGTAEIKLPSAAAKLDDAANKKAVSANATKPITITGGGLNIIIPTGTLSAGADVNALLVNPKAPGSVVRVTKPDGATVILPIAVVSGGQAAYVARIPGKYEVAGNAKAFPDTNDHWALPAIGFVSARELFKGDSTGAFNPDQPMTRGMLATVLARIDGGKAAAGTPFDDVSGGSWYAKEIAWAAQGKLVEGDGKNFNPDADLTREQLCAILVRYLDYSGLTLAETTAMGGFSDLSSVSPWAKGAVEQAVRTGLIGGKTGGLLDPQGKATRAEIATILQRFVEGVLK